MAIPSHTNKEWLDLVRDTLTHGQPMSVRGVDTVERLGVTTRIVMRHPLVTVARRQLSHQFAAAEARWIASGDNSLAALLPYAPSYARYSDDGKTLSGAYGPKVVAQLDYVVDTLIRDTSSRQAVINIWRETPQPSKDIPCTLSVQWTVRNHELHCFDTMRSSDVWLGWPYDVFSFSMLSHLVAIRLRNAGVRVDRVGQLTLTAASSHLYDRDVIKARNALIDPQSNGVFTMPDLDAFDTPVVFMNWLRDIRDNPDHFNQHIA